MNPRAIFSGLAMAFLLLVSACRENPSIVCTDCIEAQPIQATFDPSPMELPIPDYFPPLPTDALLTKSGVALGRRLFYDPILSRDSSQSCASCHRQDLAFSDGLAKSVGIRGEAVKRNAMALYNLGYITQGFFWDGSVSTLPAQALLPVEDHRELDNSWEVVEERLRQHPNYPKWFRQAFGIEFAEEINRELAVEAIAQFELSLLSYQSRYDSVVYLNADFFTEEELRGEELFFIEFDLEDGVTHPGCSHCHNQPLFGNTLFANNGLDEVASLDDFPDLGLGAVTGKRADNGKFRAPSLRNIALTAPYMHDGRFATLEEVLEHYQGGGHGAINEDANIQPFELSPEDQKALIAFMQTLTDYAFLQDTSLANPF